METNTNSSNIVDDSISMSNKLVDVEVLHVHNAVQNADKLKKYTKNSDDIKLAEELVTDEEEPWEIKENSDSDDSMVCYVDALNKPKSPKAERIILTPNRKFKNFGCAMAKLLLNDNKINELESEDDSNLPSAKKIKPLSASNFVGMHTQLTSGLCKDDLKTNHEINKKKIEQSVDNKMNSNQIINNDKCSHKIFDTDGCKNSSSINVAEKQNIVGPHLKDKNGPSCSEEFNKPSCSKDLYNPSNSKEFNGPSCSKDLYNPSNSKEFNGPSCSKDLYSPSCSKDLYSPSCSKDIYSPSCSKDFYGPSCSKDLYDSSNSRDLPGPSNSTDSSDYNNLLKYFNNDSTLLAYDLELARSLQRFYDEQYLNNSSLQTAECEEEKKKTNQGIIAINETLKSLLQNKTIFNSDEDYQSTCSSENPECFVEDPDIVNPDIMYNIDLNEHYKQMEGLVEKITFTSNDPSLLNECLQLPPIPQNEPSKITFTALERQNFAKGISEYEYEIDTDDWNKIMVKRAVVFTSHAGFNIANEESLYVLADVTISHIKKLATIMKKNFDIQSESSYPVDIDPIQNSLQEIGIKGGISELIKHYDNDVFGRRKKLLKKCQHLQKIINQYVDHKLVDPKIKNNYVKNIIYGEENQSNANSMKTNETVLLNEKITLTDLLKTGMSTEENTITNTEVELPTDPVYISNTDNEFKIHSDSNNFLKAKTDFKNLNIDKKTGSNKINISRKLTDYSDIDLLKPLKITPAKPKIVGMSNTTEESSSTTEKSENRSANTWDMFIKQSYE